LNLSHWTRIVPVWVTLSLSVEAGRTGADVVLRAELDAQQVVSSEPVGITVGIHNNGEQPIRVAGAWRTLRYDLIAPDNERIWSSPPGVNIGPNIDQLEPGQSIGTRDLISWDIEPSGYLESSVQGPFRVIVLVGLGRDVIESDPLPLTLHQSGGPDAEVMELLKEEPRARALLRRRVASDFSAEGAKVLEDLCLRYPDTGFSDHARIALAAYYSLQAHGHERSLDSEGTAPGFFHKRSIESLLTVSNRYQNLRLESVLRTLEAGRRSYTRRADLFVAAVDATSYSLKELVGELRLGQEFFERHGLVDRVQKASDWAEGVLSQQRVDESE